MQTGVIGFGVAIPRDGLGVYSLERAAVLVAVKWVEITCQEKTHIHSDSASVLEFSIISF